MRALRRGNGITALEARNLPRKSERAGPPSPKDAGSIDRPQTNRCVSRMRQSTHNYARLGADTLIGGVSR